jgi:hypothetical protein
MVKITYTLFRDLKLIWYINAGVFGVFFCAIWLLLVKDFPSQSKRISPEEIVLIQQDDHVHGISEGGVRRRMDPKEVIEKWGNISKASY